MKLADFSKVQQLKFFLLPVRLKEEKRARKRWAGARLRKRRARKKKTVEMGAREIVRRKRGGREGARGERPEGLVKNWRRMKEKRPKKGGEERRKGEDRERRGDKPEGEFLQLRK